MWLEQHQPNASPTNFYDTSHEKEPQPVLGRGKNVKSMGFLLQNVNSADIYKYFLNPYYMPSITDSSGD